MSTRLAKQVGSRLICFVVLALAAFAFASATTLPVHANPAPWLGRQGSNELAAPAALLQFTSHGPLLSRGERAVGIGIGGYDATRPLFMDPTLTWNTFLGGGAWDDAVGIAVDANGNSFVVGTSSGTWGSPIRAFGGNDAYVAKLNASGALVWNTFLGGAPDPYGTGGFDAGLGVALDATGNIYVAGYSNSGWQGTNPPVRAYSVGEDGFVAKLDPNGTLLWNTFLGDFGKDEALDIAVDANGNVYVSGSSDDTWQGTNPPVRPYTPSDPTGIWLADGFVAKVSPSGEVLWNTFLGGRETDRAAGITVGQNGTVYVVGWSDATWQGTKAPIRAFTGNGDAFVASLTSNGALTWNTFLGGTGIDIGNTVAVDGSGNVLVAGNSGANWGKPVDRISNGDVLAAFVAKLAPDGNLMWNTFLGGRGNDDGRGVAVDVDGNIYLVGNSTAAWGKPLNPYTLGSDAFAAKLSPNGRLTWNTFVGGSGTDYGYRVAIDGRGCARLTGQSDAAWGSPVRAYTPAQDQFAQDGFVANVCVPLNTK